MWVCVRARENVRNRETERACVGSDTERNRGRESERGGEREREKARE